MCLFVWIGSARPLTPVARTMEPHVLLGYHYVESVPRDEPVRAHFDQPCVTYVGSYEGCGCGFNASDHAFDRAEDVLELLGALTTEEQAEFLAGQRSRERLRDLVIEAAAHGDVEVYSRWAGDEAMPPESIRAVDADFFARSTRPIEEGVKLRVARAGD